MIGKVVFSLDDDEEAEAVLGEDGQWACTGSHAIEFDLNTDLSVSAYSPADGKPGYLQLHAAAKRLGGRVEAPEPNPDPDTGKDLIY